MHAVMANNARHQMDFHKNISNINVITREQRIGQIWSHDLNKEMNNNNQHAEIQHAETRD